MPAGISIGVGADTRDFASGVQKGLISPLEDTQQVLEDLARQGDATGDRLEDTFRDQQRATSEYARDYKRMSDDIRSTSRRTNAQIGDDSRRSSHEVSEGVQEAHDSLRSNAIETAASFDGSFEGIAGGLQGLLSEFAAGFGPAGVVVGLVAASGLGLLVQQIEGGTEAAEAQKEAIKSLAAEYIETGQIGQRTFDAVRQQLSEMATSDSSDVIITLQDAFEKAKLAGADYQDVVTAIASTSPGQIAKARAAIERLREAHDDAATAATNDGTQTYRNAIRGAQAARQLGDALDKAGEQARAAGRAQKVAAAAGISDLQLKADAIGQVEDAYDDAAAGASHFNKKTGEFDATGYLKEMRKIRRELLKFKDDLAESDLSPAAKKFLESQGAESAAAMLRGYRNASPQQKAELGEIWRTAGTENATSYEDALGKKVSAIKVNAPKVETPVVPAPDTSAIDRYLRQPHVVRFVVDAQTRNGVRIPG